MKTVLKLCALLGIVAFFFGCSTPASRIDKNPETFSRLTPDQQALIRAGKVGISFDKDMVRLALGEPERVSVRTDASGKREIWKYVSYEGSGGMIMYSGPYHRFWDYSYYPYYPSRANYHAHTQMTVVFGKDGRVTRFEERK
jgi:outer membrane protein assembly factor BamE (lipoprotein component of BamABCDE complex)